MTSPQASQLARFTAVEDGFSRTAMALTLNERRFQNMTCPSVRYPTFVDNFDLASQQELPPSPAIDEADAWRNHRYCRGASRL